MKNAELDQYAEGKYGRFRHRRDPSLHLQRQRPHGHRDPRPPGRDDVVQHRCPEPRDEARRLSPQEVDPIDEETQAPAPAAPQATAKSKSRSPRDPLVDTTPFGSEPGAAASEASPADDAALFGALWPLGDVVKLDATVDRRVLRQQRDRLGALGCEFAPLSQDWHLARPDSNRRVSGVPPPTGGSFPGGAGLGLLSKEIVMQLASRFAYRSPVLRSNHPLSDDQIRTVAPPSSRTPARKAAPSGYSYIPTAAVLTELRKEGFQPFMVCQTRVRQEGTAATTPSICCAFAMQVRSMAPRPTRSSCSTSHDGTSSYQMLAGMFRFVCQNGLVCGDTFADVACPTRATSPTM